VLILERIAKIINDNNLAAEHLVFAESCHSVEDAAKAAGCEVTDFVKNICYIDGNDNLVVAIVKGEDRVSKDKIRSIIGLKIRSAKPDEILQKSGFVCGGVRSFGFDATFLIDERVMEKKFVITGGGSENSLLKISPKDIIRLNNAKIVNIRE